MTRIKNVLGFLLLLGMSAPVHGAREIVVALSGNDFSGVGTLGAPYRTLTRATQVALSGDTIHLLAGVYGAGENWPVTSSWPPAPNFYNVPNGVRVYGDRGAVLNGGGAAVALAFAGDGAAEGIEIRGFQRAVLVPNGKVSLYGLYVHDNSADGVFVYNTATARLRNCRVSAHGWGGLVAFGSSSISASGGRIDHNRTGIYANDSGYVEVSHIEIDSNGINDEQPQRQGGLYMTGHASLFVETGSHIHNNRYAGIYASGDGSLEVNTAEIDHNGTVIGLLNSGINIQSDGQVLIQRGSVHDNRFGGINWDAGDAKIDLDGVDIYSNEHHGLFAAGTSGGGLVVRNTTIRQNMNYGVILAGSPGIIDFGYHGNGVDSPGNNSIRDAEPPYPVYQIRDGRGVNPP